MKYQAFLATPMDVSLPWPEKEKVLPLGAVHLMWLPLPEVVVMPAFLAALVMVLMSVESFTVGALVVYSFNIACDQYQSP